MNVKSLRVFSCTALLAVAACGDSATDVATDLTEAEAEALAEVVGGTVFSTWEEGADGAAGAPARAVYDFDVDVDAPCEFGGSVGIVGEVDMEVDDETQDVTLSYTVTQEHASCVVESQDGLRFTLDGAPDVTATLLVESVGDMISIDGGYSGAVDWSTDDKEGTCSLSVEFTADLDAAGETGSATMSGTVCGVSVTNSLAIS